jgi:hypothetical protein
VFGGMTSSAFHRAVSHGNGWYGFALDLDGTKKCLAGRQEARQRSERPQELGELEISTGPGVRLDLDTIKRFADLGVHRLILLPRRASDAELLSLRLSEGDMVDFVKQTGDTLVGRA